MSENQNESLTIKEVFEAFLKKLKVSNVSNYTIIYYKDTLSYFIEYIGADTISKLITNEMIEDYIIYLKDKRQIKDITINSYLRAIRAFIKFGQERNNIDKQIKVKMIKTEKQIKENYSDQELEILLKKPDKKSCTFTEFKTWAFVNYLLGTGNRITTAINVKICDIDFDNFTITLQKTKNRKQQIIPLSNTLAEILQEYLCVRGGSPDDYLFCNQYGEQSTRGAYQKLVIKYNKKRGVNKTSVHAFRHTFAKNWILSGGDIFRLQKILGHSDISVTKEYLQMFGQDLQMDFERFNPLDRLSNHRKNNKIEM